MLYEIVIEVHSNKLTSVQLWLRTWSPWHLSTWQRGIPQTAGVEPHNHWQFNHCTRNSYRHGGPLLFVIYRWFFDCRPTLWCIIDQSCWFRGSVLGNGIQLLPASMLRRLRRRLIIDDRRFNFHFTETTTRRMSNGLLRRPHLSLRR